MKISELTIILISAIILVIGIRQLRRNRKLVLNGVKTDAIVYQNNYRKEGSRSAGLYYPVIRFKDEKNELITQELSIGLSVAKQEGTNLKVLYDRNDISNAALASPTHLWIIPGLLTCIGIVGFIVGFLEVLDVISFI